MFMFQVKSIMRKTICGTVIDITYDKGIIRLLNNLKTIQFKKLTI